MNERLKETAGRGTRGGSANSNSSRQRGGTSKLQKKPIAPELCRSDAPKHARREQQQSILFCLLRMFSTINCCMRITATVKVSATRSVVWT